MDDVASPRQERVEWIENEHEGHCHARRAEGGILPGPSAENEDVGETPRSGSRDIMPRHDTVHRADATEMQADSTHNTEPFSTEENCTEIPQTVRPIRQDRNSRAEPPNPANRGVSLAAADLTRVVNTSNVPGSLRVVSDPIPMASVDQETIMESSTERRTSLEAPNPANRGVSFASTDLTFVLNPSNVPENSRAVSVPIPSSSGNNGTIAGSAAEASILRSTSYGERIHTVANPPPSPRRQPLRTFLRRAPPSGSTLDRSRGDDSSQLQSSRLSQGRRRSSARRGGLSVSSHSRETSGSSAASNRRLFASFRWGRTSNGDIVRAYAVDAENSRPGLGQNRRRGRRRRNRASAASTDDSLDRVSERPNDQPVLPSEAVVVVHGDGDFETGDAESKGDDYDDESEDQDCPCGSTTYLVWVLLALTFLLAVVSVILTFTLWNVRANDASSALYQETDLVTCNDYDLIDDENSTTNEENNKGNFVCKFTSLYPTKSKHYLEIRNIIVRQRVSRPSLLRPGACNPQNDAVTWMAHVDERNLVPSVDCNGDTKKGATARDEEIIQRYIAVVLYMATGGSYWTDEARWLNFENECTWKFVKCRHHGTITGLKLIKNNLVGNLPPEIGKLSHLQKLVARDNILEGMIPSSLGELSHLESLILSNNMFEGTVPASIANATKLDLLDLRGNRLSGEIPSNFCNWDIPPNICAVANVSCSCCASCSDELLV